MRRASGESITTTIHLRYCCQVVANARRLASALEKAGYGVVTGGTDTHIVWLDLRAQGVSGAKAERALEEAAIAVNKNTGEGGEEDVCLLYFCALEV